MKRALWAAALTACCAAAADPPPGLTAGLKPPPLITLKPPEPANRVAEPGRPLKVGTHRSLPADALKKGAWARLPNGEKDWRIALKSPGAEGLRVHFTGFRAAGGNVWIYSAAGPKPEIAGPYTAAGPNGDGDFWSETIFADSIVIEYKPARGESHATPPFRIPEVAVLALSR